MSSQNLRDRNVAWFDERPDHTQITPAARHLLKSYSQIPEDEVTSHVISVRNEAWEIFPYPCIGQFRFLDLSLQQTREYPQVLDRLRQGERLLDMACCFGQEIRQLVADGAPSENIYGCDLREEYIELGYKLFGDRSRLQAKFLIADIFDDASELARLEGIFNMIYAGSFFHLFGYDDQIKVSTKVARLLQPQKGSIILGRQVGALLPAEHDHTTNPTGKMYRHNPESLKQMWKKIGDDLGVAFSVHATLEELSGDHFRFHTSDTRRIWFVITRE